MTSTPETAIDEINGVANRLARNRDGWDAIGVNGHAVDHMIDVLRQAALDLDPSNRPTVLVGVQQYRTWVSDVYDDVTVGAIADLDNETLEAIIQGAVSGDMNLDQALEQTFDVITHMALHEVRPR